MRLNVSLSLCRREEKIEVRKSVSCSNFLTYLSSLNITVVRPLNSGKYGFYITLLFIVQLVMNTIRKITRADIFDGMSLLHTILY